MVSEQVCLHQPFELSETVTSGRASEAKEPGHFEDCQNKTNKAVSGQIW